MNENQFLPFQPRAYTLEKRDTNWQNSPRSGTATVACIESECVYVCM